jgi:RNA polymerase sigma-70 factor (ECF subfamily)
LIIDQLIKDCKKNNPQAQEQIYRLLSPKIFSICLKYSRNYEEAQDNLQEGFMLLFEKIDSFGFKGSFEGWAKRVVINFILRQYKTPTTLEIVSENYPDDSSFEIEDNDLGIEYLTKLIQELPDRYRLVFNLYVLDEYSHKEIAEMLQITVGTSKSNLARGKMILKDKIEALNRFSKKKTKIG